MKLEVKPLRSQSFYDYFLFAIKLLGWLTAISILIYIFFALLISAIKSPEAFGRTVLILALITIAFVFIMIFLNIAQKIIYDRMVSRQEKRLEQADRVIERFRLDTNSKFHYIAFKGFLKHLSILEMAAGQRLTEAENEDLSRRYVRKRNPPFPAKVASDTGFIFIRLAEAGTKAAALKRGPL